jgi:hypothetical protein
MSMLRHDLFSLVRSIEQPSMLGIEQTSMLGMSMLRHALANAING